MNVGHQPADRVLNDEEGNDSPMEHFRRGSVVQPFCHESYRSFQFALCGGV